jgi:hypothetical protein
MQRGSGAIPPKLYAVMAMTSVMTFATLASIYELLFARQLFA